MAKAASTPKPRLSTLCPNTSGQHVFHGLVSEFSTFDSSLTSCHGSDRRYLRGSSESNLKDKASNKMSVSSAISPLFICFGMMKNSHNIFRLTYHSIPGSVSSLFDSALTNGYGRDLGTGDSRRAHRPLPRGGRQLGKQKFKCKCSPCLAFAPPSGMMKTSL